MAVKSDGMFTYHMLQDRERKNLAILELIRKKSPISKAEISRALGYNIVTITNYLDYYIEKRVVLEVGLDVSSGGRRPELLELNARSGYIVGIDVGPDSIIAVVTDLKIKTVSHSKMARPAVSMEALIPSVVEIAEDVIKKSKVDRPAVKCIGIGASGIVDYSSGTIRDTDPVRGRTKIAFMKIVRALQDRFDVPVYIGNDASCAAFGEKTLNPGGDVENMVYMYSDVGSGLIVHGDVYIGSSGCAGEIQVLFEGLQRDEKSYPREFVHLRPWGVDLGLVAEARKVIEKGVSTEILAMAKGDAQAITKENIIDAAKKNDMVAVELIGNAAKNLGVRTAHLVNLFNPDVVIIGGGVEKAGDILMDPLRSTIRKYAFEEPMSVVKIIPSLLGENAIVLGAAALAAREVFINE
jgi:predicted NBD/HSP70 family sugar kinase